MNEEKKKPSCLDRKAWYHNDCKDLEYLSTLNKYECEDFNYNKFMNKHQIKQLPSHKLDQLVKSLNITETFNRDQKEAEIHYKPFIKNLEKYIERLNRYLSRLRKCTVARQTYYEECLNNSEGHIEDDEHKNARQIFNKHVRKCDSYLSEAITRLAKLKKEYEVWRKENLLIIEQPKKITLYLPEKKQSAFILTEKIQWDVDDKPELANVEIEDYPINESAERNLQNLQQEYEEDIEEEQTVKEYIHNDEYIESIRNKEVELKFLRTLQSVLKATHNGVQEKQESMFNGLMKSFNISPFYFAIVDPSLKDVDELAKIIVEFGSEHNEKYWEQFFIPFYIFEDDKRVGQKSKTGYPFLSSNRSYPFFLSLMENYLNFAEKHKDLGFNQAVFNHIIALLNRKKLEMFFGESCRLQNIRQVAALLDNYMMNRVGYCVNYMGEFMEKYNFTRFTCEENFDNIKRLEEYISNQDASTLVSVKCEDVKYKVRIDWKPKNQAKEVLSIFIKEFKARCAKFEGYNRKKFYL